MLTTSRGRFGIGCLMVIVAVAANHWLRAEPPGPPSPELQVEEDTGDSGLPIEPGVLRLDPKTPVWLDRAGKRVFVDGKICLRKGQLEMFACPSGTKEHESIVSVPASPSLIHTALLAAGARQGKPTQFQPKYRPVTGDEIDITVVWKDEKGVEHRVRAQEMVLDVKRKKAMSQPWIFGGSSFWKDEKTRELYYEADSGDFICVSNFPDAMLDVPVESSDSNDELEFAAFTERIPPIGTKVRLILTPKHVASKPAAAPAAK